MLRAIVAFAFGASAVANAQVVTLAEAKTKNAVQLSADDLKQLMPGAKVVSRTSAGNTRNWENNANGTLVAASDGRGVSSRTYPTTAAGSWRLADNGTYCVKIQWGMSTEDWCRYILKVGDKYYTFATLEDTARAWEFELSK